MVKHKQGPQICFSIIINTEENDFEAYQRELSKYQFKELPKENDDFVIQHEYEDTKQPPVDQYSINSINSIKIDNGEDKVEGSLNDSSLTE